MAKKSSLHIASSRPRNVDQAFSPFDIDEQEERDALIEKMGLDAVRKAEARLREAARQLAEQRQAEYLRLFPGSPDRARRLGWIYQKLHDTIVGNILSLDERDRADVQSALESVLPLLTGRPQRQIARINKAPKLWADRDQKARINPALFTLETYQPWIGKGLTRQQLRELDPQLYHALSVWEHRHPEDRIKDLPTTAEVIDEKIALLSSEFSEDELRKLGTTLQTRLTRSKK